MSAYRDPEPERDFLGRLAPVSESACIARVLHCAVRNMQCSQETANELIARVQQVKNLTLDTFEAMLDDFSRQISCAIRRDLVDAVDSFRAHEVRDGIAFDVEVGAECLEAWDVQDCKPVRLDRGIHHMVVRHMPDDSEPAIMNPWLVEEVETDHEIGAPLTGFFRIQHMGQIRLQQI